MDSSILLAVITGVWSLAIPALMMVITPQEQKTLSTFLLYLSGGVTVGAGAYVFGYQAGRRDSHPLDAIDEPPPPPIDEKVAFHIADPVNGSAVTGVMKVRGTYIRLPKGFDGSSRLWLCMESNLNYRFYQIVDVNFDPMNQNWHVDVDFDFKNGTACTVRVLWVDTVTDAFLKANAGKIVRQYPSVGTIEQVSQLVTLKLSLPVARVGGNDTPTSPANWQVGEITGLTSGSQPGTIKSGFIMGSNGQEYFFNPYLLFSAEQASDLKQGIRVVFEPQPPLPGGKNPQATKIFLIDSMISLTLEQDIPAGTQGNDRIQTVSRNYTHGLLVRNLSGQLVTAGSQVNCKIISNAKGPVAVIQ